VIFFWHATSNSILVGPPAPPGIQQVGAYVELNLTSQQATKLAANPAAYRYQYQVTK
jgi:hypothetical protein